MIVSLLQFVEENGNEFITNVITDESLIVKVANSFLSINVRVYLFTVKYLYDVWLWDLY